MMKYISLLRGINVGGHKIIKMADLKSLYESLGFKNVVTYILSGNVIFDAPIKKTTDLKEKIEKAIEEKYQFDVHVETRTNHGIGSIIKNNPFGPIDLDKDGKRVLVAFLSSEPKKGNVADIKKYVVPPEKLVSKGKELYLHYPNGVNKSKLTTSLIERKLGVRATARNWRTVVELFKLSCE